MIQFYGLAKRTPNRRVVPGRKPIYNSQMPESTMSLAADFPAIIV